LLTPIRPQPAYYLIKSEPSRFSNFGQSLRDNPVLTSTVVNMLSLLVFFIMTAISVVTTAPIVGRTSAFENIVPATFHVSHEGKRYNLKGTVQEVVAQMDVLHPGFEANLTASVKKDLATRAELQPRQPASGPPLCIPVAGQDWSRASVSNSQTAMSYLQNENAEGITISSAYPGPGACSRISCSYGAAIWWCNDVCSLIEESYTSG
jgi:hypothetical protein